MCIYVYSCKQCYLHVNVWNTNTIMLPLCVCTSSPFPYTHHPQSLLLSTMNMLCTSLKMLYKWNYTVSKFWGWLFALSIRPLIPSRLLYVSMVYPFSCWVVFHCTDISVCSTIHTLKDTGIASCTLLLWIELLWSSMYRVLCEHIFSFLWRKCPSCDYRVIW